MKKLSLLLVFASIFVLGSCSFHKGNMTNHTNHSTVVQLSEKNFKVKKRVEGSASATYFMAILGGLSEKALIAKATEDMYEKAGMEDGAKASINVTVETHNSILLIIRTKTVTVSGTVIEFTK